MRILHLLIATTGLVLLVPATGVAQSPDELADMSPEQRREYVQGLSETEREALREQRRAQWDAMSDEERDAARRERAERRDTSREAMREKWDSMSEEERDAAREQRRAKKEQRQKRGQRRR